MKFTKLIFILLFITTFLHCTSDETPEYITNCKVGGGFTDREDNTFYNITVLLDLSNRIEKDNQSTKDLEIVNTILDVFQGAQQGFGFQMSKDRLSVEVCKQKGDKVEFNINQNDLIIDMDKDNSRNMNFPTFCKQKESFIASIDEVYNYAITNKSFYGADVWNYFNEGILSNLKKDKSEYQFKNKVIILTDGYLNFHRSIESKRPKGTFMKGYYKMRNNPNWVEVFENRNYKLTPHDHEYHNLEVMILEVDPKKPTEYTNEFDILSHDWKTWFEEMGISCQVFPKSKPAKDLIPMLRSAIFK